jgi:hypothetical protein
VTTRATIAAKALTYNGVNDGTGYPGPYNVFEQELGRPTEYWCGDFVSAVFKMCGLPLPVMQAGMETGFASVPMGWEYAQSQGATASSWEAEVADLVVFSNDGVELAHVELAYAIDGTNLYTIGGDSGPSNIDGYTGQGGVHRHVDSVPPGVGNSSIAGVIRTGLLVGFVIPPAPPIPRGGEMILVQTTGPQVGSVPPNAWFEYEVTDGVRYALHVIDEADLNVLKIIYGKSWVTLTTAEFNELDCTLIG